MVASKVGQGKGRRFTNNPGKTAQYLRTHPEAAATQAKNNIATNANKPPSYRAELQAKARSLKIDGKGMVKPGSKKTPQDITHPNSLNKKSTLTLGSRKKNRRQGGVHKA